MGSADGRGLAAFKPHLDDALRRWAAYWEGELLDRPVVCVTAPRPGRPAARGTTYRERVEVGIEALLDRVLSDAEATYYGAEALPQFCPTFGPGELALFCGAELCWSDCGADTNWTRPFALDWDGDRVPALGADRPLWRRMQEVYRRGAERLAGRVLLMPLDFHSNLDLLAAVRGCQRLCEDLVERPEAIDRAMVAARRVFAEVWEATRAAGRMAQFGYAFGAYRADGLCLLQCDTSALISPAMFRRWVRPALEEEAALVGCAIYHWDGPRALVHFDDVVCLPGIHTLSFVPEPARRHLDYVGLYRRVQAAGRAVQVWGSAEELKALHAELMPQRTMYVASVASPDEADALVEWFRRHT